MLPALLCAALLLAVITLVAFLEARANRRRFERSLVESDRPRQTVTIRFSKDVDPALRKAFVRPAAAQKAKA